MLGERKGCFLKVDDWEWIELAASIEEGILVPVHKAAVKGEAGVGTPDTSNLDRLPD